MKITSKIIGAVLLTLVAAGFFSSCGKKDDPITKAETKDTEKPGVIAIKDIA